MDCTKSRESVSVVPDVPTFNELSEDKPDDDRVVNEPAAGVPAPIAAGASQSAPSNWSTLRFETFVVLLIVSGAVPVEMFEINRGAVMLAMNGWFVPSSFA
jgi:hypothetical protein